MDFLRESYIPANPRDRKGYLKQHFTKEFLGNPWYYWERYR